MKTLENLTKKELIKYIIHMRPKANAYDRVCEELEVTSNILGYIKKINKSGENEKEIAKLLLEALTILDKGSMLGIDWESTGKFYTKAYNKMEELGYKI